MFEKGQLIVNWWFGILGIPPRKNPFHKGILSKPPGPKQPIND